VQVGREPDDRKPMSTVGPGACEIRVRDRAGAFRVLYAAKFRNVVCVLHAFQKKSQKTSRRDIELARARYRDAKAEASVMLLRAQLAEALRNWMEREGLTQAQAAKRLGIAQPRVSDIVRNKVELMSLDYLVGLCAKAKLDVGLKLAA